MAKKQTKYNIVIDVVNKTQRAMLAVQAGLKKITSIAGGVVNAFKQVTKVIAGMTVAISAIVLKSVSFLDTLGKTASKLGVNAEFLQKFRFAGEQTGVAVRTLDMGLQRFIRRIAEARKGLGESRKALQDLGIDLVDQNGNFKDMESVLFEVADGIQETTSSAEQVRLAFKFFDSEGVALVNTLKGGSAGLKEFYNEADQLGFIISSSVIKNAEKMADSFNIVKKQISALAINIIAPFLPVLTDLSNKLSDLFVSLNLKEGGFEEFGKRIAIKFLEGIKSIINGIASVVASISTMVNDIGNSFKQLSLSILKSFDVVLKFMGKEGLEKEIAAVTKSMGKANLDLANSISASTSKIDEVIEGIRNINSELQEASGDVEEEIITNMQKFRDGFQKAITSGQDSLADFEKLGTQVASTLETGLTDAFMNISNGAMTLKNTIDSVLKMIVREFIKVKIVTPFLDSLGIGAPLSTSTEIQGLAKGGAVSAGRPYIVGEQGPELFLPNQSGTMVPNNQLAGANVNVTYNIQAFDSRDTLDAITTHAPTIVNIVEESFRRGGRVGGLR